MKSTNLNIKIGDTIYLLEAEERIKITTLLVTLIHKTDTRDYENGIEAVNGINMYEYFEYNRVFKNVEDCVKRYCEIIKKDYEIKKRVALEKYDVEL